MSNYIVFKRAWWKTGDKGQLVPNSNARKTTLRTNLTETEAREFCRQYNNENPPDRLSVKAEYTKGN